MTRHSAIDITYFKINSFYYIPFYRTYGFIGEWILCNKGHFIRQYCGDLAFTTFRFCIFNTF